VHAEERSEESEAHLNHADMKKRPPLPQAKIQPSLSANPLVNKVRLKIGNEMVNQTEQYKACSESQLQ
jgi:hypothetical protein